MRTAVAVATVVDSGVGSGAHAATAVGHVVFSALGDFEVASAEMMAVGTVTMSALQSAQISSTSVGHSVFSALGTFSFAAIAVGHSVFSAPQSSERVATSVGSVQYSSLSSGMLTAQAIGSVSMQSAGSAARVGTCLGTTTYSSPTPVILRVAQALATATFTALGDFIIPAGAMEAVGHMQFSAPGSASRTCTSVGQDTFSGLPGAVLTTATALGTVVFSSPGSAAREVKAVGNTSLNGVGSAAYVAQTSAGTVIFSSPALMLTGIPPFVGVRPVLESVDLSRPLTVSIDPVENPATITPSSKPVFTSAKRNKP